MLNAPATLQSNLTLTPKPKRRKWLRFGIPMVLVLLGLGGFGLKLSSSSTGNQSELITQTVERKTIPISISANGTVNANRSINLSPKTAGVITALLVEEGDRVRQGQVIALMDDSNLRGKLTQMQGQLAQQEANLQRLISGNRPEDIAKDQARLNSAKAELRQAQADVNSNQLLYNSGAISRQTYQKATTARDQAQAAVMEAQQGLALSQAGSRREEIVAARAQVLAARGALETAQAELNDTQIVAPFDGIVIEKYADVGAFVSPSMAGGGGASASSSSILLLSSDRLQVVVNISEAQIAHVKLGQSVAIKADAVPGERFTGTVEQIAPQATMSQNVTSFEVRVAIDAPGQSSLKAGMNVEAEFAVGQLENALVLPNAAVVRTAEGTGVYLLNGDREPVFQPIQTGITVGNQTEVKSGLQGTEQVLLSPPTKPAAAATGIGFPKAAPQ